MYQIPITKLARNLFTLPVRRFIYNNLIGGASHEIDVDSYHVDICRSMNDHIVHRFTISHAYLTVANYFKEERRFDGFTGV